MFDFDKKITENIGDRPLICAHRGLSGGNIPCNSMTAFKAALMQHADMIELDVTKSKDGTLYVFHPGKESAHLKSLRLIPTMSDKGVEKLRFVNQDNDKTQFQIEKLEDVLNYLKGKCYINVDKFWMDIPGITECIKKCGVEKQVLVKTPLKDKYYEQIEKYASDLMFVPILNNKDNITDKLLGMNLNFAGVEICFDNEDSKLCSEEFINKMHDKGIFIFSNAIVYNYKTQLAAGHSDDTSLTENPDKGWGWLIDKGFDIIQTDWCGALYDYMTHR